MVAPDVVYACTVSTQLICAFPRRGPHTQIPNGAGTITGTSTRATTREPFSQPRTAIHTKVSPALRYASLSYRSARSELTRNRKWNRAAAHSHAGTVGCPVTGDARGGGRGVNSSASAFGLTQAAGATSTASSATWDPLDSGSVRLLGSRHRQQEPDTRAPTAAHMSTTAPSSRRSPAGPHTR